MNEPAKHVIRRAIISVSDKTGIVEFAKELSNLGIEIFSTGGTAKTLESEGIAVRNISEITGFPEVLDGRVKTLHPAIHAGILAVLDNAEHLGTLETQGFQSIDMVVVNLYPFEKTLEKQGATHEELVENIDIGGPTMLRSAAKNYLWTAPVVNPARYSAIIEELKSGGCTLPVGLREELAADVFSHTGYYDSLISGYFSKYTNTKPDSFSLPLKLTQTLRYGENPHQEAALYGNFGKVFTQLHGKELSYNNILDIDSAARIIIEFSEPAVAIIKHTNPSGVGLADTLSEAYNKAFATDTVSPFGGIIVVNRTMTLPDAETMNEIFTELIIAPDYTDEALELLMKKKNRRLIRADYGKLKDALGMELKSVTGGFLMQSTNNILLSDEGYKVVTKRQPTDEELKAMLFGWKIVKHVKSNAIVYSTSDRTLGVGAGQMSRVDSARIAVEKAKMMNIDLKGSAVSSDAFFPFSDGPEQAAEAGATAIIQPGGSVRDEEVIKAADNYNMTMIFTGIRHFKH
jgi:phosphoribosylaminoimidazolecarboxamide formyltransferase / IMP cyclohydrolase